MGTNNRDTENEWLIQRILLQIYGICRCSIYQVCRTTPKTNKKYKVEKQKLKDTTHSSINYKYIETNVDMSFNTLKEAIENKN